MNIGIAGAGTIVPEFLKAAQLIDDFIIVAICGRISSQERMTQLAKESEIQKIYLDYEEMLEDVQIDAVYIAVPNHLHFEYAQKAILKHKNVILEKPFTSNYEQAKQLATLSKQENVFLFEAITNQYFPNFIKMKERLKDLGQIKIAQLNYTQYSKRYDLFKEGTVLPVFDPKMSGGALMDLNVYNIHIIVGLFGEPVSVSYHANIERNIDTSGVLVMDYPDFKCVCIAAKDCEAPVSMNIQGDKGYFHSNAPSNVLESVEFRSNLGDFERYELNEVSERFFYELQFFNKMCQDDNRVLCYERLHQSLIIMKILEDARRQAGIEIL